MSLASSSLNHCVVTLTCLDCLGKKCEIARGCLCYLSGLFWLSGRRRLCTVFPRWVLVYPTQGEISASASGEAACLSGSLSLQLALLFQAQVDQSTGLFFFFLNDWSIFPWQGLKCSITLCMTMAAAIFGDACWQ